MLTALMHGAFPLGGEPTLYGGNTTERTKQENKGPRFVGKASLQNGQQTAANVGTIGLITSGLLFPCAWPCG